MNTQDDFDLLSQYLDGELDSQQSLELKQRLLAEPDLNKQLRKIKNLNTNIQEVMPDYDEEPLSDDLAALLAVDETEEKQVERPAWYKQYLPMAASVMFIMVLANVLINQSGNSQQVLPAGYNLSAFSTNVKQTIASGGELIIVQSYADNNEQLCREYFAKQQKLTEHGVSCFEAGNWQKRVYSVESNDGQDYMTASGDENSVEAFLASGSLTKLNDEQEKNLLKSIQ